MIPISNVPKLSARLPLTKLLFTSCISLLIPRFLLPQHIAAVAVGEGDGGPLQPPSPEKGLLDTQSVHRHIGLAGSEVVGDGAWAVVLNGVGEEVNAVCEIR